MPRALAGATRPQWKRWAHDTFATRCMSSPRPRFWQALANSPLSDAAPGGQRAGKIPAPRAGKRPASISGIGRGDLHHGRDEEGGGRVKTAEPINGNGKLTDEQKRADEFAIL